LAVLLLCMLGALSACASTGPAAGTRDVASANIPAMGAPDSLTKARSSSDSADYKVGPQDLLEISVFQVTDLNRTVRVNTSGDISLPLIGIVHAGGRTVQEVEDDISGKLRKSYLQNPQVSVFVK
jgi:polysaccharide export outer membrane protein